MLLFGCQRPNQATEIRVKVPVHAKTENELRLQERIYTLAAKMSTFAVMREALIDIRETTNHTRWTRNTQGWEQVGCSFPVHHT
jgi:hypothetical protein